MCCCEQPTVNGEGLYSWDGKTSFVRQPDPPTLDEKEELIFDGPGRCGGIDSHAYHFRLVKHQFGRYALLVKHGGGEERFELGHNGPGLDALLLAFQSLDSNNCYWMLQLFYKTLNNATSKAKDTEALRWRTAVVEKRLKTRKQRNSQTVKVWIE